MTTTTTTTQIIIQRLLLQNNDDDESDSNNNNKIPHVLASVLSNVFLFVLIFGLSVTVPVSKLKKQLRNVYAVGTGIVLQFGIMPALGYAAIQMGTSNSSFTFPMGLALLVVTSSPGGSYSNWWCSVFNADLALSVAMTAISTILSIGLLPANLLLYSHLTYKDHDDDILDALDFSSLFLSLGIVIGAILLGLLVSWKIGKKKNGRIRKWANHGANLSGLALIVFSALLSSLGGDENSEEDNEDEESMAKLWSQEWTFYTLVAFPCLVGMILSNALGKYLFRLSKPECVTIAIECAYQNVGIAVSVSVTLFSDPVQRSQALVVPLYYGLVEAILIGMYCIVAWKAGWTKAPPTDRFCQVVSHSYVGDDDDDDDDSVDNDDYATNRRNRRRSLMVSVPEGDALHLPHHNDDDFLLDPDTTKESNTPNRNRLPSEDTVATTGMEIEC